MRDTPCLFFPHFYIFARYALAIVSRFLFFSRNALPIFFVFLVFFAQCMCVYLHMSRERFSRGILELRCELAVSWAQFPGFWKCGGLDSGWLGPEARFPDPGPRIPALWVPDPGHVGLKMASCWLQVGLETPKMVSRGLQDASKIENFEAFARKTRKCVPLYYSNVFWTFLGSIFIDFWIKIDHFFNKIRDLLPRMPQEASRWPQDGPTWLSGGNLGPTWAQVGSKLRQDEPNLALSWLKLGPSWAERV